MSLEKVVPVFTDVNAAVRALSDPAAGGQAGSLIHCGFARSPAPVDSPHKCRAFSQARVEPSATRSLGHGDGT
jgi:hypothetical protein